MATPRRPKKSVIQFVVAALIALVVGGLGIVVTVMIVGGLSAQNAMVAQEKEAEKQKLQAELERLKQEAQQKQVVAMKRQHEVRAAVMIPEGVKITLPMLTDVELEPGIRPASDSFSKVGDLLGQFTARAVAPNDVITDDMLVDTSNMLPVNDGMRAISINVDKTGGVSGAIVPGARVDVMVILEDAKMSKTLLQNVRVIAAGGSFLPPPASSSAKSGSPGKGGTPPPPPAAAGSGGAITLEVNPEQAELLALANQQGSFHLALRGFGDKKNKTLFGADMARLLSGDSLQDYLPVPPKQPLPKLTARSLAPHRPGNPAGLPEPGEPPPEPAPKTFSLQILKGPSSETKEFEWTD